MTSAGAVQRWTGWLQAAFLVLAGCGLALAARPRELVALWPLQEDGFYSLTVARNVALGRGPSVDGVTPTNGFQPLFTLLTVPLFLAAGEDRYLGLRLVLALHAALYAATALVAGAVARTLWAAAVPGEGASARLVFWMAAVLYMANPLVMTAHFNGLETGAVLFLYACVWRYTQTRLLERTRELLGLGALLGLTVLARVDAVFFAAMVCAWRWRVGSEQEGRGLRRALTVALVAGFVSLPWWLYNVIGFGSLVPSSGRAQWGDGPSLERLAAVILSLGRVVTPWWGSIQPGRFELEPAGDAARVGIVLAATFALWRSRGALRRAAARPGLVRAAGAGACLALAVLALAAWYGFTSFAVWFAARYLSPLLLVATVALALLFRALAAWSAPVAAAAVLALLVPVPAESVASHAWPIYRGNIMYRRQLAVVEQLVPAGDCVAALQSGTLGYFRDGVLNLDGKVNAEALARRDDVWRYLRERRVRWLCDWPELFRYFFNARPERHGWRAVSTAGKFVLWARDGPAETGGPAPACR